MQSSSYDELNNLLKQIQDGLPHEKKSALAQLVERVERSNDPQAWNILGIGYLLSGYPDAAVNVFNKLVSIYPQQDNYRLNLGTAYSQAEQVELAQYYFQQLAENGTTEKGRRDAQQALTALERRLGRNQLDKQFRQHQVTALYERLSKKDATQEDYRRLAFLLLQIEREPEAPASLTEITALLEAGQVQFPQAVAILELLALCYSRQGFNDRLMNVVKKIEKFSPDSPILQALDGIDDAEAESAQAKRTQRAYDLVDQSHSQDRMLRQAAFDELRKLVTMWPSNADYRSAYAFALTGAGLSKDAVEQAEILASSAGKEHKLHFNVGQIFWLNGELKRGSAHMELAAQYATSEEERRDVQERIAYLRSVRG